jgi:hypothetical protein
VASEISKGVIELRSNLDKGLVIIDTAKKYTEKSGRKWVYFCVVESDQVRNIDKKRKKKCFYGEASIFDNVKEGKRLLGIEYGLKNRVYNDKGYIPIGSKRYFYPAQVIYEGA